MEYSLPPSLSILFELISGHYLYNDMYKNPHSRQSEVWPLSSTLTKLITALPDFTSFYRRFHEVALDKIQSKTNTFTERK